jgi:hypothetical protein
MVGNPVTGTFAGGGRVGVQLGRPVPDRRGLSDRGFAFLRLAGPGSDSKRGHGERRGRFERLESGETRQIQPASAVREGLPYLLRIPKLERPSLMLDPLSEFADLQFPF